MRGWSGLKASADTVIFFTDAHRVLSASVEKHRNWHSGGKFHFRLAQRVINSQDFESTSCVVEHVDEQGFTKVRTDLQRSILDAYAEFDTECNGGCTMEMLTNLVVTRLQKSKKSNIKRSIKGLVDQGGLTLSG